MNNVSFKPVEEFISIAEKIFQQQKKRILAEFPLVDIQHIGSTAIPGSITKGDLDIQVRVSKKGFGKTKKYFEKLCEVNQQENWSDTFASFKNDNDFEIPVGIQLTVIGSTYDNLFQSQLKLLIENPDILKEYNQMKRKFEGKNINDYYNGRSQFFDGLKSRGFLE